MVDPGLWADLCPERASLTVAPWGLRECLITASHSVLSAALGTAVVAGARALAPCRAQRGALFMALVTVRSAPRSKAECWEEAAHPCGVTTSLF